jgi:hypothetical protein
VIIAFLLAMAVMALQRIRQKNQENGGADRHAMSFERDRAAGGVIPSAARNLAGCDGGIPRCARNDKNGLTPQRKKLYLKITQSARKPSRHPIFFPSA